MPSLATKTQKRKSPRLIPPASLRSVVSRLAWLDGRILWHEGRIVYEYQQGDVTQRLRPSPHDIAQAHHALLRIERSRQVGGKLGGKAAWIAERRQRLEEAKRLREIVAPDIGLLARPSRERNPATAYRLAELLIAEAVCLNELPFRPSTLLCKHIENADHALWTLYSEPTMPQTARALAALVLGARSRHWQEVAPAVFNNDTWSLLCFQWGQLHGLPSHPSLAVALLQHQDGATYVQKCEELNEAFHYFNFAELPLREMLEEGLRPDEVVRLARAASRWEAVAEEWSAQSRAFVERTFASGRIQVACRQAALRDRDESLSCLANLMNCLAGATYSGEVLDKARLAIMHPLERMSRWVAEKAVNSKDKTAAYFETRRTAILQPVQETLQLPPHLQLGYLQIIEKYLAANIKRHAQVDEVGIHWSQDLVHVFELLRRHGDLTLTVEILDKGLQRAFAYRDWQDVKRVRWFLGFIDQFGTSPGAWQAWHLYNSLDDFKSLAELREALDPVVKRILKVDEPLRYEYLLALLEAARWDSSNARSRFNRLASHLDVLLDFAQRKTQSGNKYRLELAARSALEIDECLGETPPEPEFEDVELDDKLLAFYSNSERDSDTFPAALPSTQTAVETSTAQKWIQWMLKYIAENEAQEKRLNLWEMDTLARLSSVLSEGDFERFKTVFRRGIQTIYDYNWRNLRQGLFACRCYPGLYASLCACFRQNPRRCIDFLVRVGLATKLGKDILTPLELLKAPLEAAPIDDKPNAAWYQVLQLAPELAPSIRQFRAYSKLVGQDDAPLPNIQRVVEEREKRHRELLAIEERLKHEPERTDLQARATSLRNRMNNDQEWRQKAVRDLTERSVQATAERHLLLAEQQLKACYRERLRVVAGNVPSHIQMDADLLNATLLSTDIEYNRRLLRRLLRAHLDGDTNWRERHPANAKFLQQLGKNGVDVRAWLEHHPKRYRYAKANGGGVRLHCETEPILILQMGNYFDTCLSFGGCNSFSTVTNASELNKRVIYATDKNGHVVGRKLIGISEEGKLVGFHTYTSLQDNDANTALCTIFRRYIGDFAAQCRLELADEGIVPKLFAQKWYDDGVIAWDNNVNPASLAKRKTRLAE